MLGVTKSSFLQFTDTLSSFLSMDLAEEVAEVLTMLFLGSFGDSFAIRAYYLSELLLYIGIQPFFESTEDIGSVRFSIAYGARNYRIMINDLYKTLVTLLAFVVLFAIIALFSPGILMLINVDVVLANEAAILIRWSVVYSLFEVFTGTASAYISAQGKINLFRKFSFVMALLSIGLSYFFIVHLEMKHLGTIPVALIEHTIETIYVGYIVYKNVDPRTVGKPKWVSVFKGYSTFIKRVLVNALASFFEYLTFELNSIMAIQLGNPHNLTVYLIYSEICHNLIEFGDLFADATRVIVGKMIGRGQFKEAKAELSAHFVYVTGFSLVVMVLLLLFRNPLAYLLIRQKELSEMLSEILVWLAFTQWGFLMLYPLFEGFLLIEMENFFTVILGTFYTLSDVALALLLGFYFKMHLTGIVVGQGVSVLVTVGILLWKLMIAIDWDKLGLSIDRYSSGEEDEDEWDEGEWEEDELDEEEWDEEDEEDEEGEEDEDGRALVKKKLKTIKEVDERKKSKRRSQNKQVGRGPAAKEDEEWEDVEETPAKKTKDSNKPTKKGKTRQ